MNIMERRSIRNYYLDLLTLIRERCGYAQRVGCFINRPLSPNPSRRSLAQVIAEEMAIYYKRVARVTDKIERRVLHRGSVRTSDKIVSLFEPHTDIIVRDHRDTPLYGHNLCFMDGASNFIADCVI